MSWQQTAGKADDLYFESRTGVIGMVCEAACLKCICCSTIGSRVFSTAIIGECMQTPSRSNDTYYVAAVTTDGTKVLDYSQIDEEEVKSYVSPIGLDVLRNYWNFTISADINCLAQRISLPKELQDMLGIRIGQRLQEFRNRVEKLPRNVSFVIVTTYGVEPPDLLHRCPLKRFIDATFVFYEIPSRLRRW